MRLIIVVEGQTEEAFVNQVLAPHLANKEIYVSATIVGKLVAQKRRHRSRGGGHFSNWQRDIQRILGGDRRPDLRVSTLFDLYGLPRDFPGLDIHATIPDTAQRCAALETALASTFDDWRFIPYIQRHEFEALVLAALPSLRAVFDAEDDLAGLRALETELAGAAPEDINDGKKTSPSKRLLHHLPGFNKTLHGPLATSATGLVTLRRLCPRFDRWVSSLEQPPAGPAPRTPSH